MEYHMKRRITVHYEVTPFRLKSGLPTAPVQVKLISDRHNRVTVHAVGTVKMCIRDSYYGQAYELTITVPNLPVDQKVFAGLAEDFSQAHEQAYGFKKEQDPLELVSLRLSAVGQADHNGLYAKGIHGDTNAEPEEVRKVYFMGKWMKTCLLYTSSRR